MHQCHLVSGSLPLLALALLALAFAQVNFAQDRIERLPELNLGHFDFIECSGVGQHGMSIGRSAINICHILTAV